MRILFSLIIAVLLCAGWFATTGWAQSDYDPRQHHRWARFAPGAWCSVHEETENFEDGKLVGNSTTKTTTRLKAVDAKNVTLVTDVKVEIAGKVFNAQPQTVTKDISGGDNGQATKVEDGGAGQVTVGEQRIPCRIRRLTTNGGSDKRITTIHFSDAVAPFELRRETVSTDAEQKTLNYQTNAVAVAVNLPYQVLSEIQTVAFVKTVHTSPKGRKVTIEVHSPEVPGGVVAHWSTEFDDKGGVLHRSVLRLVDYGLTEEVIEVVPTSAISYPRRTRRVSSTRGAGVKGR